MDPMIGWLTSTFGTAAPDVASAMGLMPPNATTPPGMPPTMGPTIEQMNGVEAAQPGAPTNVWEPQPQQAMASATPQQGNQLTNALRAMAAPTVPTPQRVGTPAAPRMGDIKGGELLAMLLATGDGGVPGGRRIAPLPSTLGQALNVPRY